MNINFDKKDDKMILEILERSMNQVFIKLEEEMEKVLENNKKNLIDTKIVNEEVVVDTILIDKNEYYKYSEAYFPMVNSGLNDLEIYSNNDDYENIYLGKIFLNVEYSKLSEIEEMNFEAWINIEDVNYPITINLVRDNRYLEEVKKFYNSFGINGKTWRTINLSLLKRMYKIKLINYNFHINREIFKGIEEERYKIEYNFERYEEYFLRDRDVYWNVEEKQLISSMFVKPNKNDVFYEYILNISEEENILVKKNSENILFVYMIENKKIKILSRNEREDIWGIYNIKNQFICNRVIKNNNFISDENNLRFNNYKGESFLENLIKKYSVDNIFRNFITLEREFSAYEKIKDEMKLWDIKIGKDEQINIELYNCNSFIDDNLFSIKESKRENLNIYVKKLKNSIFFQDNFSFIIGEIQRKYFEYDVIGYLYE